MITPENGSLRSQFPGDPEKPTVSTRSFTFLVNPSSGGGAAPEAVVPVARLLREAGSTVDVTYSPGPRAMGDLVAAAIARGDVVVSVGGDGMLSSLAGSVSQGGGTLALLPAGPRPKRINRTDNTSAATSGT